MTRKATTTTPDPELSTPLGNEPDKSKPLKKAPRSEEDNEQTIEKPIHEPLEVEHLEGRQESDRED